MKYFYLLLLAACPFFSLAQHRVVDSLKLQLPTQKNDSLKIKLLQNLSFEYASLDADVAVSYGKDALALSEKLKLPKYIASSSGILASAYYAKGNSAESIRYNKRSLKIHHQQKDRSRAAAIYSNISTTYLNQSNYTEALKAAFEALKIYDETREGKYRAIVLENIGHIYFEQSKYDKTTAYYHKALALYEKKGDDRGVARLMGNLARVLKVEKKFDKALDYLFTAMKTNTDLGLDNSVQSNMANIGNVYLELKDYDKAVEYHRKALAISEKLGGDNNIAVNNGNLGSTYFQIAKIAGHSNQLQPAIRHLEKAVALCDKIGFSAPQIEFSAVLTEAYQLAGNYKLAYLTLKSGTKLRDSIFSMQSKVELQDMETKRDLDLRDKDIIIQDKQLEIKKLEATKNSILYVFCILALFIVIFIIVRRYLINVRKHRDEMANVIHIQSHMIRGPLASILGLVNLLRENAPDNPENVELISGINELAQDLDEVITKVVVNSKH